MKRILVLFLALIASVGSAQVYRSPLHITRFTPSQLSWTNDLAAHMPVYQLLGSTTVTGNWQHLLFVTNATSTAMTNSATTDAPAVFHKLGWFGDAPMLFDYEFEENDFGFGPCIHGQMMVSLLNNGTWDFEEDGFCFEGTHVTGSGTLRPRAWSWTSPHMAQFDLTNPPDQQFLEATLQSTMINGTLVYTGMVGTVYQNGFAGATAIGTFRSRRLQ